MLSVLTKFPLIFLAYLAVLLYYCIFDFNLVIALVFACSLGIALYRKYFLLFPVLLVLTVFFFIVATDSHQKMTTQAQNVSQIKIIPDSIQVNGDLLSFQGNEAGEKYQVYDTLQSEKEKKFYENLKQNCTISFTGNLEVPERQRNFNGFDEQKYLAAQGIYREIIITSISKIKTNRVLDLHVLRRSAIVWVQSHFPKPMSNYMTGLLFGYLDKDFEQMGDIYSSLGIIHLFALSGMQVNFFIDGLRKILLRLGIRRDIVDILQIPFSIIYAFLTGLSVSILRALFQKNIKLTGLDNIALTTLILMFVSPKFLLTAGGQLTLFYAFAISMLSHLFISKKESLTEKVHLTSKLKQMIIASSALSLLVLPVLIFNFYIFQPLSILLTIGFGVLFDLVLLPLLLTAFLLSLTGLTLNLNWIFKTLEAFIQLVDRPFHYPLILGKPNAIQLILLLIITALLLDFWTQKKLRWLLLSSLFIIFFTCKNPSQPTITAVDVGQGDSIFLKDRFNKQTILIDTGGRLNIPEKSWQKAQTESNASKTLIPYLESEGVSQIDQLILTHTDDDHVGDFLNLADKIKIKEVWVSPGELTCPDFVDKLKKAKIPIHLTQVGDEISIFNSQLQVLSNGYTGKGDNNDSIVTYGNFYGKKFLFTGDLEQDGEMKLLKNYPDLKVDILKAGHHGSKTSSNPKFIKQIQPQLAIISVGKNNHYGHPNQQTLDTFKKYKVKSLRTDQNGAIKLTEIKGLWRISTVR
ncbi:MAG: DNA internalization-related competence protein ComEC/Rec2 [Streptococcaceae bacterium]|nr:DNA internalization-related competence protein ComEC/Rec2 [Streptococcaceae bacterium]